MATVAHLEAVRPESDDSCRLGGDPGEATRQGGLKVATVVHLAEAKPESADSSRLGEARD